MAKKKGITGWHAMRKEQLVSALLKLAKQKNQSKSSGSAENGSNGRSSSKKKPRTAAPKKSAKRQNARVVRIIREEQIKREQLKDLASVIANNGKTEPAKDRVVLLVRDPYWLQAYWEITRATVQRAGVAMADRWHLAQPVIRLFEIVEEASSRVDEQIVRDIPVHGGVKNWFIDVSDPPRTYRVAIGYKTSDDNFYLIAKSNKVTTPIPNSSESIDNNWTDIAMNYQKFFALSGGYTENTTEDDLRDVFEQKLRRPMTTPMFAQIAAGAHGAGYGFEFSVDAEMIIYGKADPNASVTLAGEPVKLRADGTFEVRMSMPDRRQVLPVVACSRDGTEQRTTVLAIERNTKTMEPISRDPEDS